MLTTGRCRISCPTPSKASNGSLLKTCCIACSGIWGGSGTKQRYEVMSKRSSEWACLQRSRPRSARRRRLLSVEELAERRTASEAILGLIELPDVESILGADSDELLRRMTGPKMPPPGRPTIWLPPRGTWRPLRDVGSMAEITRDPKDQSANTPTRNSVRRPINNQ